jgi:hypothetical protein
MLHLVSDPHAEHTRKARMRMLSRPISSWCVCSGYASVPDAYAQGTHQFLMRMLSMFCSWCVCSGYASVPDAYAQHVLKGLRSVHVLVPDPYAQCTSSWLVCSVHASVPDAHAQHARKFLMRMLNLSIKAGAYASGSQIAIKERKKFLAPT